ncbi:MAG TPA: hypothetical protein DCL60_12485 [Armatimonadetes bacterium]|nr:hypothetical protein [Armatimonadota bacterium]
MNAGFFWSLASAFLWSTTFVCARYLLAGDMVDPITLSLLRFSVGGVLLLLLGIILYKKDIFAISLHDLLRVSFVALFGMVGMSVLLFFGQRSASAINSSLIMQLSPVFILFMGVFIGERIGAADVAGVGISLIGTLMVVGVIGNYSGSAGSWYKGELLVLAAAFSWAIYSVVGKGIVCKIGGYKATTWAMLAGSVELLILWLFLPAPVIYPKSHEGWIIIAYLAIFPTAIAFFAWYEAMRTISLSLLNVMQYLTPAFTIILAMAFLHERMQWLQWIGMVLILAGVMIIFFRREGLEKARSA